MGGGDWRKVGGREGGREGERERGDNFPASSDFAVRRRGEQKINGPARYTRAGNTERRVGHVDTF